VTVPVTGRGVDDADAVDDDVDGCDSNRDGRDGMVDGEMAVRT